MHGNFRSDTQGKRHFRWLLSLLTVISNIGDRLENHVPKVTGDWRQPVIRIRFFRRNKKRGFRCLFESLVINPTHEPRFMIGNRNISNRFFGAGLGWGTTDLLWKKPGFLGDETEFFILWVAAWMSPRVGTCWSNGDWCHGFVYMERPGRSGYLEIISAAH